MPKNNKLILYTNHLEHSIVDLNKINRECMNYDLGVEYDLCNYNSWASILHELDSGTSVIYYNPSPLGFLTSIKFRWPCPQTGSRVSQLCLGLVFSDKCDFTGQFYLDNRNIVDGIVTVTLFAKPQIIDNLVNNSNTNIRRSLRMNCNETFIAKFDEDNGIYNNYKFINMHMNNIEQIIEDLEIGCDEFLIKINVQWPEDSVSRASRFISIQSLSVRMARRMVGSIVVLSSENCTLNK